MAGLDDLLGGDGQSASHGLGGGLGGGTNKELMAEARMALSGNWGMAVLGHVLYYALWMSFCVFLMSVVFFMGVSDSASGAGLGGSTMAMQFGVRLLMSLLSGAFVVGFMGFFLGIAKDNEARLDLLFVGFRRFFKSFVVYFFYGLMVFLLSLLLIIPGIIGAISFSMAFFCIADDGRCGPFEALGRSRQMMKGNKWKFFCLQWRFFWWALLCAVIPIGWLWLFPYIQTSYAKFYEDVK